MVNTTCPIKGCDRPIRAAGLCDAHYRRKRKYGDPEFMHGLECAKCGKRFESHTLRSKYCSSSCRAAESVYKTKKNGPYKTKKNGPTCAECGVRMHRGKGVLPQGQARCLECKNGGLGYFVKDGGRWSHGLSAHAQGCRCDVCVMAKREANMAYKARVKAEHGVSPSTLFKRHYRERTGVRYKMAPKDWIEPDLRLALYERDDWVCHLCGELTDPGVHFNDDAYPSLDHVVPRSLGGTDDPENLATCHRVCNSLRGVTSLVVLEVV